MGVLVHETKKLLQAFLSHFFAASMTSVMVDVGTIIDS